MMSRTNPTKRDVAKLERGLQEVLHFSEESRNIDFYISALTEHNPFNTTEEIQEWLRELCGRQYFDVERVPLAEMRKWYFEEGTGDLKHESGGFFSIRGLKVATNIGPVSQWSQPIIHQAEIGVLGILTKKIDGILYLLLQAKAEPGNINTFQLSPTVQATRSNYLRLHGGTATRYLNYFLGESAATVLVDQLQSEQGARFYRKRNRNIIVRIPDDQDIDVGPNHRWATLGQVLRLTQASNTVNMDTRSVISGIGFEPETADPTTPVDQMALRDCLEASPIVAAPVSDFGLKLLISSHPATPSLHSMDDLLLMMAREKFTCDFEAQLIPLDQVCHWTYDGGRIYHEEQRFFSVIGVRVAAENRETDSWDQPIVQQEDPGIVGFIAREIDGVIHFLAQLKMESGVMDLLEISPTVQCITGNYGAAALPAFVDDFLHRERASTVVDTYQSEEGGRFFHESNQNIVLLASDAFPLEVPPRYIWMSLGQLKQFIKFNNYLNVEARSLLACLQMR